MYTIIHPNPKTMLRDELYWSGDGKDTSVNNPSHLLSSIDGFLPGAMFSLHIYRKGGRLRPVWVVLPRYEGLPQDIRNVIPREGDINLYDKSPLRNRLAFLNIIEMIKRLGMDLSPLALDDISGDQLFFTSDCSKSLLTQCQSLEVTKKLISITQRSSISSGYDMYAFQEPREFGVIISIGKLGGIAQIKIPHIGAHQIKELPAVCHISITKRLIAESKSRTDLLYRWFEIPVGESIEP